MTEEDPDDMVVEQGTEVEPQTRKIQSLGRVDVPDNFWDAMGLDEGDEVILSYDGEENVVEVHSKAEKLSEVL